MKIKPYLLPLTIGLILGAAIVIGTTSVYNVTSTNESCDACHVHPQATTSWRKSVHFDSKGGVSTNCVDCHLPPKGSFDYFAAKTKMGVKDMWGYMVKDSADFNWTARGTVEYASRMVYNESCEKCHTNLFPSRLNDEGIAAHLYYANNCKELDLQCISCHLNVGHYDPNYKSSSVLSSFGGDDADGEVFVEPTALTAFESYVEQVPGTQITISMKAIPAGEFMIGSPSKEPFRGEDEGPQRSVKLSKYFMSEFEVTWKQFWAFYRATMATNREPYDWVKMNNLTADVDAISGPTAPYGAPDQGWGAGDRPAITMSHYAAETFCLWLSKKTGKTYRLPTEAEWEYAARGGTDTPYFFEGSPKKYSDEGFLRSIFKADTEVISSYVIYNKNSDSKTHEPSAVAANPYGLKNMMGNVMEYCADKYSPDAYARYADGVLDPAPNSEGEEWVVRGGAFYDDAADLRVAKRSHTHHDEWIRTDPQQPKSIWWYTDEKAIGFRVVCEWEE